MDPDTRTSTEIARTYAGSEGAAEAGRIARRLETWGNIGLLTPVGERHSGRGRARGYDRREQVKAAVLLSLFAYQTPKAVLQMVSRLFDDVRRHVAGVRDPRIRPPSASKMQQMDALADLLAASIEGRTRAYLVLTPGPLEGLPKVTLTTNLTAAMEAASAVVVNVTAAARRMD